MKIFLGADHRGFELKQKLLLFLQQSYEVTDLGAYEYNREDDYNDPAIAVAKSVLTDPESIGILLCGSSYGVCIQANRFKGIRAISGFTPELVEHGRTNDDANVLCLDADTVTEAEAEQIINVFLNTNFTEEPRYIRRRQKLDEDYQ